MIDMFFDWLDGTFDLDTDEGLAGLLTIFYGLAFTAISIPFAIISGSLWPFIYPVSTFALAVWFLHGAKR